jgi:hypothetical protein
MTTSAVFKDLSPTALAMLGLPDVAYVKPVEIDGVTGYAVYAADGNQLTVLEDRDSAFATILENDMEPVSVH